MDNNTSFETLIQKIQEHIDELKNDETSPNGQGRRRNKSNDEYEKIIKELKNENNTKIENLKEQFNHELEILKEHLEDTEEFEDKKILLEKKYYEEINKVRKDAISNIFTSIKGVVGAVDTRVKDIQDSWGKADDAAYKYGRSVGLASDSISKLRTNTLNFLTGFKGISEQYNINAEELINLQGSYNKGLARAVSLNGENLKNLISLRNVMGETAAINLTTNLDKFGIDIDAAGEMMSEMYNDAGKKGIVLSQLSENFLNNIDLAQQYTFQDGVEGLRRMAEQATSVKWNMQQTAAFAEKVNTVEGAVKTGAQLSVLGGPFAQFSNPMGMLYESLNDMEGLQDRMLTMFKNLGSWNNETNQFEVSVFNRQRIKAATQAMGLNYGDVMNNIYTQARREKVLDAIKNLGLDNETTELIANTGQIDKNGQAYVNITGNDGSVTRKNITSEGLNPEELAILRKVANKEAEDIKDIARNTMSTNEKIEGIHKQIVNNKSMFYDTLGPEKWLPGIAKFTGYTQEILNQITMILGGIQATLAIGNSIGGLKGIMKGGIGGSASSILKNPVLRTSLGLGVGAAGFIGGTLMNKQAENLRERGNHGDADSVNAWGDALNGLGVGASLGATVGTALGGPLIGTAIGAGVGAIAGGIYGVVQNKKLRQERVENQKRNALQDYIEQAIGVRLNNSYTSFELEKIKLGKHHLSNDIREKLKTDGVYDKIPSHAFADGGLITGPSHSQGGVAVNGTNIEVEGGEFVINKTSTQNNLPLIKAINDNKITSLQPIGEMLTVSEPYGYNGSHQVSFDMLNSNVSGNIRLDLGNYSREIDGKELLSNPNFISKIRDILIKEINMTTDKSFNKNGYYRKW